MTSHGLFVTSHRPTPWQSKYFGIQGRCVTDNGIAVTHIPQITQIDNAVSSKKAHLSKQSFSMSENSARDGLRNQFSSSFCYLPSIHDCVNTFNSTVPNQSNHSNGSHNRRCFWESLQRTTPFFPSMNSTIFWSTNKLLQWNTHVVLACTPGRTEAPPLHATQTRF